MHHGNIHRLLSGIGALAVCAAAVPALADLIHHWTFDTGVNDVVGGKTGTIHGTSSFVPGVVGNAFYFDGSTYITTDYTPQLGSSDSMSIAAWVQVPTGGVSGVRDVCGLERSDHQEIRLLLNGNDNTIVASYRDDGHDPNKASAPQDVLNDGQWHHLAGIRDKGTGQIILYVDGVAHTGSDTGGNINQSSSRTMDIGADNNSTFGHIDQWLGAIDDLRFYDHPLSQQEVDDLVGNGGNNGPDHYWPLDGHVNDVAGGNTGTVQGGSAAYVPGIRGDAFSFDGNRYITTDYMPQLGTDDSMTISSWIKIPTDGTGYGDILGFERSDHQEIRFMVRYDTGVVLASFRDDNWIHNTASIPLTLINDDCWHMITGVRDATSGEIYLYIDGRRSDCLADTTGEINITEPRTVDFGADNNSTFGHISKFIGDVDEIRFYNRALTYNEIWDLYNEDLCAADFNCDGQVNSLDFIAFLNAFTNGCP